MINVYIVSGFLGSGKTTFIQKLLKEKKFERVMLLENEFGEVGVDGAFFDRSLSIREINNGCICCSLQGDFEKALEEIEEMEISDLIIEPSGVGKLSEIINVIKADPDFRIVSHICIVDVKTCRKYHLNFKEYFDDQVIVANAIILSHTDVADEETIDKAEAIVRELNKDAAIIRRPISEIPIEELINIIVAGGDILPEIDEELEHQHHHHHHGEECGCHHHHDHDEECECHHHHHDDDEECECDHEHHHHDHEHHHHHDDELFKNLILRPEHVFTEEELQDILARIPEDIIRVKGYVHTDKGTCYFNYVLNEYNIFKGTERDEALVSIIGTEIDEQYFRELFND
ncbi:MAG: GTP-binding protein [Erysipelotrichaceae bacterium]|nr:GTP-binding protein [Erysipelotrichaceae bacterium]MBQ6494150.1 GTP-binding protein [Erysipelotrichaceae bacterium]